ncbi:uncharacterized protein LOC114312859 isoform X2 [Camellia sinensis]|uniref:uncharacterized protein LOC114312859 isoform X2 n=1 Tax=Camellia sinensis TaxID=4442 RepID=UPI0010367CA4|nr:uncharacterized protein LOC114312859 isoform X2 [Camellia sinensis]
MADSSSWYAKRSGAIVGWFRNNVVFRKAVVFMTALLFSHSLVEKGVVGILISYLEEKWDKENLTKVASVTNLQDGLSAVMMIVIAHISDTWTGRFMMVVYSTVAYVVEILADSDNNPVSTSFIPPSHPSSTTSTQRIIASTSFPDQSRNTGNVVEKKLSHQKTM